ncbi:MAG TPA: class I SAM-dependent methyltransferase [Polyangia bacterium]|nr:class I SAM-dependent methyltransferase [Polyangia bacterium]
MWSPFRDYNYAIHKLLEDAAARHLGALRGRVLDVGCGSSPYRELLPRDATYVGVDRRRQAHGALLAAADALPFADGSFDGVLCTEMIEQSPRPWQLADELARVLRPGGRLYLTAPFDWHFFDEPYDYFRFTTHGLRALLTDAGFTIDDMEKVGGMFSAFSAKLLEQIVQGGWLRAANAVGLRRGSYFLAALGALPWNATMSLVTPALDRLSSRNPFAIAVVAVRS